MRRSFPLLLAVLVVSAVQARGAEPPPKSNGQFLDLQPIGLPVIVDGRLVNYVFVNVRLLLTPSADPTRLHDKEPFVRDQIVREATRQPFNPLKDYTRVDEGRLRAAVLQASRATFGPGLVKDVKITSETPQRRTGLPGGGAPG